jgi:hypothetical protein
MMKKYLTLFMLFVLFFTSIQAQTIKSSQVPDVVKTNLLKQYPGAKNVIWEKEHGNYEANWGGKSKEDNSVQYSSKGDFIEYVKAIPVSQLPKAVAEYVKAHYKGAKITEAGLVTDAGGKTHYEAEVNKKDLIFDKEGNFIQSE